MDVQMCEQMIQSIILLNNSIMPWCNLALVIKFNLLFYIQVNMLISQVNLKTVEYSVVQGEEQLIQNYILYFMCMWQLYVMCLCLFMAYYCVK